MQQIYVRKNFREYRELIVHWAFRIIIKSNRVQRHDNPLYMSGWLSNIYIVIHIKVEIKIYFKKRRKKGCYVGINNIKAILLNKYGLLW